MTHCDDYRAAAVALAIDAAAIGIDAEPNEPLPDGLLPSIAVPAELPRLATLIRTRPDVCWDRLTFSAKESLYKVWSPLMRQWLGFEQASVTFDPAAQTFAVALHRVELIVDGERHRELTGRWTVDDGVLATSIVVRRGGVRPRLAMTDRAWLPVDGGAPRVRTSVSTALRRRPDSSAAADEVPAPPRRAPGQVLARRPPPFVAVAWHRSATPP
jgi:hypothetical protein